MKSWFSYSWLKLLAIVVVLGALGSFPYAYYQLMNWIVVAAAIVTSMQANKQDNTVAMWLFLFVAIIFNPIAPIYLRQDVWQIADIITAILFFFALFTITPVKARKKLA